MAMRVMCIVLPAAQTPTTWWSGFSAPVKGDDRPTWLETRACVDHYESRLVSFPSVARPCVATESRCRVDFEQSADLGPRRCGWGRVHSHLQLPLRQCRRRSLNEESIALGECSSLALGRDPSSR